MAYGSGGAARPRAAEPGVESLPVENLPVKAGMESLPAGLHLLSLYVRQPAERDARTTHVDLVVQLQNIVEHSAPVTLEGGVARLLGDANITGCIETTLTLQQPLKQNARLKWLADDGTTSDSVPAAADAVDGS